LLYPEDIMEQEPIYQDDVGPDELSPWDGPLHYKSLQVLCNNNPSSNNREIPGNDSSVFGLMLSVCFRGKEYRL
jgi:hypothetical protein